MTSDLEMKKEIKMEDDTAADGAKSTKSTKTNKQTKS